jgi:hypothetical protein
MCSHCGECFCFGVAKLARVLLSWLVCPLMLGLIIFFLVRMVVVFKLIGRWLCLGVQRNELYSLFDDLHPCSLVYHCFPSQWLIQCSCLSRFGVIWCFHPSPYVVFAGAGSAGAATTIIAAIAMVFLKIL